MIQHDPSITDYSLIIQTEVDRCIAGGIAYVDLSEGVFPCSRPIIPQRWSASAGYYVPFTLTIRGKSTYCSLDGSGTVLRFPTDAAFGVGFQGAKGGGIYGLTIWGGFNWNINTSDDVKKFRQSALNDYKDPNCRDSQYSPYVPFVIDPFGPSVPSDGGYQGTDAYGNSLSGYYRGSTNGSTGVHYRQCVFRSWVGGVITSPNGHTQNADLIIGDYIQFANMKWAVAGCQDQEKMNRVSNVMCWGVTHTTFVTGQYGAGSIGNWYFDHWNIAGLTNDLAYNNQSGYYPSYWDCIFAESLRGIGFISSDNGTKISNSTINFAAPDELGYYNTKMIGGYGVIFDGCQLRIYGWFLPITIETGAGANDFHFIGCGMDKIPFYPQSYGLGYSDFLNCYVGGISSPQRLNPQGPSVPTKYAYPSTSNVAAKNVSLDALTHKITRTGPKFTTTINSTGTSLVKLNDVIVGTCDPNFVTFYPVGVVTSIDSPTSFTISYTSPVIDTTKDWSLFVWTTLMK